MQFKIKNKKNGFFASKHRSGAIQFIEGEEMEWSMNDLLFIFFDALNGLGCRGSDLCPNDLEIIIKGRSFSIKDILSDGQRHWFEKKYYEECFIHSGLVINEKNKNKYVTANPDWMAMICKKT